MAPNVPDLMEILMRTEVVGFQQAAGLQVFGLKWPSSNDSNYVTLDDALHELKLEVMEIDEGGRIPILKVVNRSDRMVFLMAGEHLVGCKQNRVLDASMMVPAMAEMAIPVTCVERGRWGYQSRKFHSGGSSSHSYLRMMMSKQAYAHYKAHGAPGSDQKAVWAEVARKIEKMGSSSRSEALEDMFKDQEQQMNRVLNELSAPDHCHGAAFAIKGKIVGADLFDKPATLGKLWSKLIKSYTIDALENPKQEWEPLQPEGITEWLKSAGSAGQECFDSPGLGHDVRIEGEQVVGAMLVVEQHPIHLELFREDGPPQQG